MASDNQRDYQVGYGKPPLHSRFKRGQSGNPRGRPPGAKNLTSLLTESLNESVVIAEDGGRRKISKREAIVKQLVNKSAKGDWRAVKLLLDILQAIEGRTESQTDTSKSSSALELDDSQLIGGLGKLTPDKEG